MTRPVLLDLFCGAGGARRRGQINVWRRPIIAGLWDGETLTPSAEADDRSEYDRLRGTVVHRSRWAR